MKHKIATASQSQFIVHRSMEVKQNQGAQMWNGPTSNIDSMHIPNPMNTTVQVKFRLKTIHQLLHLTQSKRMSCDANTRTSPSGIIL